MSPGKPWDLAACARQGPEPAIHSLNSWNMDDFVAYSNMDPSSLKSQWLQNQKDRGGCDDALVSWRSSQTILESRVVDSGPCFQQIDNAGLSFFLSQ